MQNRLRTISRHFQTTSTGMTSGVAAPKQWPAVTLSDGNRVPAMGFGVGTAFFQDSSRKTVDAVKEAVLVGYRHLDAAQSYENEKCIKEAMQELEKEHGIGREKLWITTKVNKQVKDLRKTLKGQLETLGLSYVDAYLIHTPKAAESEGLTNVDLWKQMIELKKAGLARTIGVSNFRAYHLRELEQCEEMPAINQMEYHSYVHKMFRPVIEYCQDKHITLEAYSSLAPIRKFSPGPCDPVLEDVAKKVSKRSGGVECNTGQVCLMYIHAVVSTPL